MIRAMFGGLVAVAFALTVGGCGSEVKWSTTSADALRHFEEGVAHWEKFYYAEAAESFKQAIAADSMFAVAWGRMGLLHMHTLDETAARREVTRALMLSSRATDRERLLVRLWYYRVMYENVRAAAVADSLIALCPKEAEAYLVRGQLYAEEKNIEAAVNMFERAVAADTGYALGVMSLGYAYSDLGEQDKAVGYMQRYIRMAPDAADPRASYADILLRAGRYDEALEQYRVSLARKPDYWYSVRQIGGVYALLGRLGDARKEFDRSLTMVPAGSATEALRLRLYAFLDVQRGAYEDAVRNARAAGAIDSSMLGGSFQLSYALAKLKRFEEAEECLRQALEELERKHQTDSPTMQGYHIMQARVYTEQGRYDEALRACKSALEYSSPQMRGAVYTQIARTYLKARQYEPALDAVEGALGVNPNAPEALLVLTKVYNELGDRRMVIEVGDRLRTLWKDADPDFLPLRELRRLPGYRRTPRAGT
jgi:tetratricopeptide (TPR) repeat protein